MRASDEHNIILFNEFNNLVMSLNEVNILFIPQKGTLFFEKKSFFTETPVM